MRILKIDLSNDSRSRQKFFGGHEGEHNETRLEVKLPERMIGEEIKEYRFIFETSLGEKIDSISCFPKNSIITIDLWQQLIKAPLLKFCVAGIGYEENEEPVLVSKTSSVELIIDNDVVGEETPIIPAPVIGENVIELIVEKLFDEAVKNGDLNINIDDHITINQSFDPESKNAQSGVAVAEAINKAVGDINEALETALNGGV